MRSPLPPPSSKAVQVQAMFDRIASRYDLLNRIMTMGQDVRWRRRAIAELGLARGSNVLDLACGTGDFCRELERAGHTPVGYDFSQRMLDIAAGRTMAALVRADILDLPLPDGVADGATCGFALRNVVDIEACFRETARVLRPGGRVAFLETAAPSRPRLRALHRMYMQRVVPVVGSLLSESEAYHYLPASAAYLPPTATLLELMRAAGFSDASRISLGAGAVQLLVGTKA